MPWKRVDDDASTEDNKLLRLRSRDFIGHEQIEDRF